MKIIRLLSVSVFGVVFLLSMMGTAAAECQPEDTGLHLRAGAVYMTRVGDSELTLLSDWPTRASLVNTSEMELGWQPGLDISMDYKGDTFTAEFRYLSVLEQSESSGSKAVASNAVLYNHASLLIIGGGPPTIVNGEYQASLDSAELNIGWRPIDNLSIFVGPRWLQLDEDILLFHYTAGLGIKEYTSVGNKLLGGQVGVKGVLFNSDLGSADITGKVGYFNNEIDSDTRRTTLAIWNRSTGSSHNESLVAEAGLNVNIHIIKHLSLSLGYQALWMEDVITAPIAFRNANMLTGRSTIPTQDLLYHGGRASLVYTF